MVYGISSKLILAWVRFSFFAQKCIESKVSCVEGYEKVYIEVRLTKLHDFEKSDDMWDLWVC